MTNKRNFGIRIYRHLADITCTSVANSLQFNGILFDLRTMIEAYAADGQELRINKATLLAVSRLNTYNHKFGIVAMVSDADINAAAPAIGNGDMIESQLDVLTAGEFEHQLLSESRISRQDNGATIVFNAAVRADFTQFAQKFASLLARSAILSSNPYGKLVCTGFCTGTNQTPIITIGVEIHFTLHAKPLRMLT